MAKKAFLVSFSPMTRVVVDVEDETLEDSQEFSKVVRAARAQMMENSIADYLNGDTVDEIRLDEEFPYPTEGVDNES